MLRELSVSLIPNNTVIYHRQHSKSIQIETLPARQPSYGQLGILAIELFQLIVQHVDLQALAELRLASYSIKCRIDSTFELELIRKHASTAMRAMKETKTLGYHTLSDVHRALISKSCAFCGDFGPCVFVLTCERCCLNCIAREPALRLIPRSYALTYYGIPTDLTKTAKRLQIIPGKYRCRAYAGTMTSSRPGQDLVSASEVDSKAIAFHGNRERMERCIEDEHSLQTNGQLLLPSNPIFAHYPSRCPSYHEDSKVFYTGAFDGFRFTGSVEMPVFRKGTDEIEATFWCAACKNAFDVSHYGESSQWRNWFRRWPKKVARAFDEEGFLEHVKRCKYAPEFSLFQTRTSESEET